MSVTLKPELEKLVEDEVKSGRSTDSNEFLSRAVYHYVLSRDLGEEYSPEEIDRMIAEGVTISSAVKRLKGKKRFSSFERIAQNAAGSGREKA